MGFVYIKPSTDLFDSYSSPKVPIVIANLLVVIHLAGAYAMYTAPVFYLVETSMTRATKMSNNAAVAFRVIWRVSYVAIIGLLGALMPFFNAFVGLVGGITFWPLAVGLVRIETPLGCLHCTLIYCTAYCHVELQAQARLLDTHGTADR